MVLSPSNTSNLEQLAVKGLMSYSIIHNFRDKPFQAIDCIGTDN